LPPEQIFHETFDKPPIWEKFTDLSLVLVKSSRRHQRYGYLSIEGWKWEGLRMIGRRAGEEVAKGGKSGIWETMKEKIRIEDEC
jgi:hypothetical protein